MIGGNDIILPTKAGVEALDLAVRTAGRLWPAAVFEDAETGQEFDRYASIDLSRHTELLIYKDRQAANQWRLLVADASLAGTLIHLLLGQTALTAVVDEQVPAEIATYLSALAKGLCQHIFSVVAATREAA